MGICGSKAYSRSILPADRLEQAQSLVEQGRDYIYRKEFAKGIQAYKKAHQLIPDPTNLYIIARAYGYLQDQCSQTIDAWEVFFKECTACQYLKDGKKRYEDQKKRCLVQLKISTDQIRLKVRFNRKKWIKVTPKKSYLFQGMAGTKVKVEARSKGYFSTKKMFKFVSNQKDEEYRVDLIPIPAPKPLIPTWSSLTMLGIGIASLGWGIYEYQNAQTLSGEYQNQSTSRMEYERAKNNFNQTYLKGQIGIGVGSALLFIGGGLLYYKVRPQTTQKQGQFLKISLTPHSSTLAWHF